MSNEVVIELSSSYILVVIFVFKKQHYQNYLQLSLTH